jgi:hypothetical protein
MATLRLFSIPDCDKRARAPRGAALKYFHEVVMTYEGDECLIWPFSTTTGYGQLRFEGRPQLVPRLVCEKTHGPPPDPAWHAAHSCGRGDKGCVAKAHLRWKSPADNEADKKVHGTYFMRRGGAKLTPETVAEIRKMRGRLHREIAQRFHVSRRTVGRVLDGSIWKDGSI